MQALIGRLDGKQQTGLGEVYSAFIDTPAERAQMLRYVFQVFQYVPGSSIEPDFALAVARTTPGIAGNPAAIAASFAKSYGSTSGTIVTKQAVVTLPSGRAAFVEGTQPAQGGFDVLGARTQFQIYVIPHGNLLFDLSFRATEGAIGAASTFTEIARRFAFV